MPDKRRKNDVVRSEAYPKSEYNPSRDGLDGDGRISIEDILDPLHGKSGFSKLRKIMHQMERRDWRGRQLMNNQRRTSPNIDLGFSTVGAITSEFDPITDLEKKIASLVNDNEVFTNTVECSLIVCCEGSPDRLARMHILLFCHEMKAKRVKKIKSRTYHQLLTKDRFKAVVTVMEIDPEAAKELVMKQEFKRAEVTCENSQWERLTLKHKNNSKWAKHILKRGLDVQDEGTRVDVAEQLRQHALLTRKINSMKENSSYDDSSNEDDGDETSDGSNETSASKLSEKAKEKTLGVLEEIDEMPKSGVLSLPFIVWGLKKRKEAADEEMKLVLQEYESSLKQMEDKSETESLMTGTSSGRMVFGAPKKKVQESSKKIESDYNNKSDSEVDFEAKEDVDVGYAKSDYSQKDVDIDPDVLRE
ncbi:unnamed protein product [Ilex paraguariensis]|uniref:Uncharacterized protein n=1 Tax=Ilex paraguariensis TaxID=185542 RepID=A0ABC8SJA4_9AQUA